MLTMPIFMNETLIGMLEVKRTDKLFIGNLKRKVLMCNYKIHYEANGYPPIEFELKHDYRKGCESLIARALRRVRVVQKEKGYTNPKSDPETHLQEKYGVLAQLLAERLTGSQ